MKKTEGFDVTEAFLKERSACAAGVDWFKKREDKNVFSILADLSDDGHADWANWLIVRVLEKIDRVRYAVFAAEQVIDIFEKRCPDDKRPRNAIAAAKKYIDNPCVANAAADAAFAAAADAAFAAAADAYAANAAYAAAFAASAAASAAAAIASAAAAIAYAAAAANAAAVKEEMKRRIIDFGISILRERLIGAEVACK